VKLTLTKSHVRHRKARVTVDFAGSLSLIKKEKEGISEPGVALIFTATAIQKAPSLRPIE
jgi:hypothetical protein